MAVQRREIAREVRRRQRAYGPAGTLIALGFGAAVIGAALLPVYLWMRGVIALLRWRRRARQRRIQAVAARLQSQLGGGDRHTSYAETVGWLNRNWAAATPADDLFAGPYHVSTATNRHGYEVMVDFEPYGSSDEDGPIPPRLVVYVAAVPSAPAPDDRTSEATRLRSSIERAGFSVLVEPEGGLVARALPSTLGELRSDPSRLSLLQPVVSSVVALAVAQGAVPPEP